METAPAKKNVCFIKQKHWKSFAGIIGEPTRDHSSTSTSIPATPVNAINQLDIGNMTCSNLYPFPSDPGNLSQWTISRTFLALLDSTLFWLSFKPREGAVSQTAQKSAIGRNQNQERDACR